MKLESVVKMRIWGCGIESGDTLKISFVNNYVSTFKNYNYKQQIIKMPKIVNEAEKRKKIIG